MSHAPEGDTKGPTLPRPDAATFAAFSATAVLAGGNAVAVRVSNFELAPVWGATLRFACAAIILAAAAAVMRLALPRGRALLGVAVYGLLNFGVAFMFLYLALTEVTAGTAQVVLALVPLLTLLLAVVQGVERFRLNGLVGALVAAAGIVVIFQSNVGAASSLALLALFGTALSMAEVNIVIKKFPHVHPVTENAVGMVFGCGLLAVVSLVVGESWAVPVEIATLVAVGYLAVLGSAGLFLLYLFVIRRWTATGTSYILLIAPLFTLVFERIVLGERVGPVFLLGGALVIVGVYVGAFLRRRPTGSVDRSAGPQ